MISQKLYAFKMALSATIITLVLMGAAYTVMEPSVLGAQDSDTTIVSLTVTGGISVTSGATASLSPAISLVNATSTGSTTVTVITNDTDGYTLSVKAASSSAMQTALNADSVRDYTATGTQWSIAATTARFGYSVYGDDVVGAIWGTDDGDIYQCEQGTLTSAQRKYYGLTTNDQQIAASTAASSEAGTDSILCFAVEQNQFNIPNGDYTAEVIVTGIVN